MGRQSGWFARCPTTVFCRLANVVAIPLAVLQGMGRDESIALGVLTTTSLFIKPQVRKSVGMGSAGWTTTQENPMSNKPVPPNGFTLTEECEACPECSYKGCAKIGQQKRCSSCGHQWPPIQRLQQGPTRGEILNGTARIPRANFIRWRF